MRGTAFAETLRLALALHPATERVFVVARSPDEGVIASAQEELRGFSGVVGLTMVAEETVPRLLDAIRTIPPRSLVLYIWHAQTPPGRVLYEDVDIVRRVVAASPVPVYGTNDDYIGVGVVGGVVRDTRETAVRVGEIARSILNGRRAENIPIENARVAPILDWRQIRRWGIDPSRLPIGSQVRFRTPTLWESHRQSVATAIIIVLAQLLLIGALLTQRVRRQHAEEALRTREATLRTSYDRIRLLTGRLINAQEAARAEIARELHDDVCQELAGVSMALGSLKRSSGRIEDTSTQKTLASMERSALETLRGVRRLSHDLHPATLRLVGLAAALKSYCREVEERHDVQVSFAAQGDLGGLHPDIALCVFRIVQEALRNGAVHGDARRLEVSILRSGTSLELMVTDDGRGFDLESVRRSGSGLGLVSMEERARLVGGDVRILTRPMRGTAICVRLPVDAAIDPPDG
jgi:signal transduction histidine kinase